MLSFGFLPVTASTVGAASISVEDYPEIGPSAPNNPPFCGMPWSQLNLNFITAVEGLQQSECGTCLQVCGSSGCVFALAVDRGGDGLDLSTGCSTNVIGNSDSRGYAEWQAVDSTNCNGIWNQ